MRCQYCKRPLIASAVPGMRVGPKCAADRGLLPVHQRMRRVIDVDRESDPRQIDWINNTGQAGERAAA